MKKLFTFGASVFFVLILSLTSFAKNDIKPLSDIGIFEENVYSEKYVTVNELCKITSKLMNPEGISSEGNQGEYEAYLNMFKTNGLIPFDKDGTVYATGEEVCRLYVYALGYYNAAVSTGKTFTAFTSTLGISGGSGITPQDEVTYKMLAKLTHKAIRAPLSDITVNGNGNVYTTYSNKRTILSDIYKTDVYEGIVNSVNKKPYSATVSIRKSLYSENRAHYLSGATVSFSASGKVDLDSIANAPSVIWISDGKIVSAYLKENTEIKFAVVYSVNNDKKENSMYVPSHFSKIMFYDDKKEYKIAENFTVKVDGIVKNNYDPVSAVGKYARVIFSDGYVSFIEYWSFSDGGLIKEIEKTTTDTIIHYVDKTNSNACFKKLGDYESIRVIINGVYSDISLLKKNTVFSWCVCNDELIIAVNEQVISAKLKSVSDKYIELGNMEYLRNPVVYVSKGSKKFFSGFDELISLIENDVSAYFDIRNRVSYITLVKDSTLASKSFIGLATGYRYEAFEDIREMEILSLEEDFVRTVYSVNDKVKLDSKITFSSIESQILADTGNAVYEFEVNANKEIVAIKEAYTYKGVGTHGIALANTSTNISYATLTANDKTVMYVYNTPFVVVYKDAKGKYNAVKEVWSNIYSKNASGCTAYVYGYPDSTDPRLILISGKTQNICNYVSYYGVMTKKSIIADEYGEKRYKINVITNQSESEYYLPLEEGENLPPMSYINFQTGFRYDHSRTIKVSSFSDLSASFSSWKLEGFNEETVCLTGAYSFMTESGKTCFLHPYYCFVAVCKNGEITKGDISDLEPGDKIYYYYTEGDTRIVFVEK